MKSGLSSPYPSVQWRIASGVHVVFHGKVTVPLRTVGFAAWLRTPAQGFSYHVHAVAVGDPDIWQRDGGHVARDQVCDYYRGRNGLASHAADNTPTAYRVPFTWWERFKGI